MSCLNKCYFVRLLWVKDSGNDFILSQLKEIAECMNIKFYVLVYPLPFHHNSFLLKLRDSTLNLHASMMHILHT